MRALSYIRLAIPALSLFAWFDESTNMG